MANPSNRSPSPLSSRRICHQSRNSTDSNSAPRRSFSGNPFPRPSALSNPRNLNPVTPANSPAGIVRRNSLGNLHGWEEKENQKDQVLKPAEPGKSSANGSKNFMAPTISAASKFTPSPRKKVLTERSDPVRTSISLSEGKATFFSAISSEPLEDLEHCECAAMLPNPGVEDVVLDVPRVTKSSKRVTFLDSPPGSVNSGLKAETATISSNLCGDVNSASKNTISGFSVSPVIAPLDADPSLPYDPKTNFLSPRPQFLHYKPNPRIENLLNKEKELELGKPKRLEDNFMPDLLTESLSDSEGTQGSISEDSQKSYEDSSSSENVLPEVMEGELPVSESSNMSSPAESEVIVEEIKGEKTNGTISKDLSGDSVVYDTGRPKSRFFKLLNYGFFLLLLLATCVTVSHFMDASVLDSLKFHKLPDGSEIGFLAKENFNQIGARFQKLSLDSISRLYLLIDKFGGRDNLGAVHFINLTHVEDNAFCPEDQLLRNPALVEDLEGDDMEQEEEPDTERIGEQTYPDMASDDSDEWDLDDPSDLGNDELVTAPINQAEASMSQSSDIEEPTSPDFVSNESDELDLGDASNLRNEELAAAPVNLADSSHSQTSETLCDVEKSSSHEEVEVEGQEQNSDDEMALLPLASGLILSEMFDPESTESDSNEVEMDQDSELELESSTTEDASVKMLQYLTSEIQQSQSPIGIALVVSALVSAAALMYWKQNRSRNQNATGGSVNCVSAVPGKMFQYRSGSHSFATEFDLGEEESCSSEMSSYRTRSSFIPRKDQGLAKEVQSQERKSTKYTSKRESLASSSEFSIGDSASYGSFTTYEKISIKHGSGGDEIITPVRRSSRISRKQVTSP